MDVFDAWLSAVNSHDGDRLAALMADDGTYELVATGIVFSKATVPLSLSAIHDMSSDFSVTLVSTMRDGERYGIEWEVVGTNDGPIPYLGLPATGKTFKIRAAAFGQTEGGKIKLHREYWEVFNLLSQVDLPPKYPAVQFALASLAQAAASGGSSGEA